MGRLTILNTFLLKMVLSEKESLPPSYDEVVNPSAPPTQGNQPVRQPMNPGWNTQPSHLPQYPVMAQPMIYQQPQQIPQQSEKFHIKICFRS